MHRLRIVHTTTYTYAGKVGFGRHRLVLRPREGHDLRVESLTLGIEPAHEVVWVRDVFGNSVAVVDFLEEAEQLSITNDVLIQRSAPFPSRAKAKVPWDIPYPISYDPLELPVASAYQALTYAEEAGHVREWLKSVAAVRDATTSDGKLAALQAWLHENIDYARRPERGVQTPAQTLALKKGSCRDLATLMLEGARLLGFAARFASGYLDCAASTAGRASTHAWTEVYLPLQGWRAYDPTVGQFAEARHVTCGVSNHPRGVMPVTGTFSGAWPQRSMLVAVKIETVA